MTDSSGNWSESGTTPFDPDHYVIDVGSQAAGILAGTPIVGQGFFTPVDGAGGNLTANFFADRDDLPSLFLLRDRLNGLTTMTAADASSIDFTFSGTAAGFEKAVVDQGFLGATDVTGTGLSLMPSNLFGLGLYVLRDRTMNTVSVFITFASFSQGVENALTAGGASLFNVGAFGIYTPGNATMTTGLAGVTVQ